MKMKKQDISRGLEISVKADSPGPAGNKVSPITDATLSSSKSINDQCGTSDKKNKLRGDKAKTISRMKELIRWAAAKSGKGSKLLGVKVPRNQGAVKADIPDNDQLMNKSPKISFRWDVESCYSVTSAISMPCSTLRNDQAGHTRSLNSTPVHDVARNNGNWIMTDSEFVVLEL